MPSDYDNDKCFWTCADYAGKGKHYSSDTSNNCEDEWSQFPHCGKNRGTNLIYTKGKIKDYCKMSCNNCGKN